MDRDEQIELMQSAQERTTGYLREWMADDAVKAALMRKPRPMVGLFADLTEEQRRAALDYRGAENHGDAELRRSKDDRGDHAQDRD